MARRHERSRLRAGTLSASVSTSTIAGSQASRGRHQIVRRTPVGLAVAVLVVLAAHAVATPFGLAYLVHGNVAATDSSRLRPAAWGSLETVDRSRVHATLVPMLLPGYVAPGFIAPYNRQDLFLQLAPGVASIRLGSCHGDRRHRRLERRRSLAIHTGRPHLSNGRHRSAHQSYVTTRRGLLYGRCPPSEISVTLPAPIEGAPLVVDVQIHTLRPLHFVPAVKTDTSWTYSPLSTGSAPGTHRFVTWLPGNALSSVALTTITPFSSFCVRNIQVGVMITAPDQSGQCHSLADEGSIGSATPCGRPWE